MGVAVRMAVVNNSKDKAEPRCDLQEWAWAAEVLKTMHST